MSNLIKELRKTGRDVWHMRSARRIELLEGLLMQAERRMSKSGIFDDEPGSILHEIREAIHGGEEE